MADDIKNVLLLFRELLITSQPIPRNTISNFSFRGILTPCHELHRTDVTHVEQMRSRGLYATSGHGGCLKNCVLYFWPKFRKIQGEEVTKSCSIYGVSVNYVNSACYLSKVGALLT